MIVAVGVGLRSLPPGRLGREDDDGDGAGADVITELGSPTSQLTLPGPDVPMPHPDRIAAVSRAHGIENASTA